MTDKRQISCDQYETERKSDHGLLILEKVARQIGNLYGCHLERQITKLWTQIDDEKLEEVSNWVRQRVELDEVYCANNLLKLFDIDFIDLIRTNEQDVCWTTLCSYLEVEGEDNDNGRQLSSLVGDLLGETEGMAFYYILMEYLRFGGDRLTTIKDLLTFNRHRPVDWTDLTMDLRR